MTPSKILNLVFGFAAGDLKRSWSKAFFLRGTRGALFGFRGLVSDIFSIVDHYHIEFYLAGVIVVTLSGCGMMYPDTYEQWAYDMIVIFYGE
jgi:hypothetical protein